MNNIISLQDVTFQYEEEQPDSGAVLKNLSLSIEQGSFTVILGHNGSGKSTLAKLLNGLLKPDSGTVLVDGLNTKDEKQEFEIRRRVGMIFQNPDNQLVCSVVEEDVAFGPENLGVEPKEIRRRVDAALQAVNMTEFKNAAPFYLSGGQKQRVAIAGVLAMQPKVLVLDEPTAMLDPVGRREVMNTVWRLNKEQGMTVVLITHYMEEADGADRVLVMDNGKITADDTPIGVFSNPELLKKAGLALPQTAELLLRLKQAGLPVEQGVINAKQTAKAIAKALKGGRAAW